jgi:hypothetical protein
MLFAGMLYHEEEYFRRAREELRKAFGEIAMESPPSAWEVSDYYREELGWPLARAFIFFREKIDPLALPGIKCTTNDLEARLSAEGRRTVNIDPGYMTLSKVVLASTKNYSHRLYIGKGVFAELSLVHVKGKYRPHLFTYSDYSSETSIKIFEEARRFLKLHLHLQDRETPSSGG